MTFASFPIKRPWVAALLFVAFAVRMVVPSGWMPTTSVDGIRITICSGMDIVEATLGIDGKIHKSSTDEKSDKGSACAFAGIGAAYSITDMLVLGWSALSPLVIVPSHYIAIGQGLAAPPPPSTGPPALI